MSVQAYPDRRPVAMWLAAVSIVGYSTLLVWALVSPGAIANVVSILVPGILSTALGVLVVWRRPENRFGTLLVTIGLTVLVFAVAEAVGSSLVDTTMLALRDMFGAIGLVALLYQLLFLLPLWFPTGTASHPPWDRVVKWGTVGFGVALATVPFGTEFCVEPGENTCLTHAGNPLGIGLIPVEVGSVLSGLILVGIVASFVGLVARYRRGSEQERLQIRWLLYAVAIAPLAFIFSIEGIQDFLGLDTPEGLISVMLGVAFSLIPLACGLAVLRYRLYEIDRIISRSVTYASVVGLLAGAVAGVAAVAGTRFDEPWVVAATTLGVAAVFNPLRRRVKLWVDRRFNRSRYDAERVMEGFVATLRDEVHESALVEGWVSVVAETMQPVTHGVWMRR